MRFISFVIFSVFATSIVLAGCAERSAKRQKNAELVQGINSVLRREITFPKYPVVGNTYLSFSTFHGFQVTYFKDKESSWLWYANNQRAVTEEWKIVTDDFGERLCFRHPENTYNPVTKKRGGKFQCQGLSFSRKLIVAKIAGDPFDLASGKVPFRRAKCEAPEQFEFDRKAHRC